MPGDFSTVQAVAAVLAASQKYMRDQSVSCKILFPKSCLLSYCCTKWGQGAVFSVISNKRECWLTSHGKWIAHETYFPVLHYTCSLGALRDDTKNSYVAK